MTKVGIIGGGNMGEAIIAATHKKHSVSVCERDQNRQRYLQKTYHIKIQDFAQLVKNCRILILAVKPQNISEVLVQLKTLVKGDKLIVSIAAGVATKYIEKKISGQTRVIRAMPNLPAQVQQGTTVLCKGKKATSADLKTVTALFDNLGTTLSVKESQMDAVTAISGSGPGYFYLFMEELIAAGASLGLSNQVAKDLVVSTAEGSVSLVLKRKEDVASLRAKVTSKGGTTQAAMDVFKKEKFGKIIRKAAQAAAKRSKTLSRS